MVRGEGVMSGVMYAADGHDGYSVGRLKGVGYMGFSVIGTE